MPQILQTKQKVKRGKTKTITAVDAFAQKASTNRKGNTLELLKSILSASNLECGMHMHVFKRRMTHSSICRKLLLTAGMR